MSSHTRYSGSRESQTSRDRSSSSDSGTQKGYKNSTEPSNKNTDCNEMTRKESPARSCGSNPSTKENHFSIGAKLGVDEDGFKPYGSLNCISDAIQASDTKQNQLKEALKMGKHDSITRHLSKDAQFLIKVKKFRKGKEKEDAGLVNGF